MALRNIPTSDVGESLSKLAGSWDGRDRYYLEAIRAALVNRDSHFVQQLFDELCMDDVRDCIRPESAGVTAQLQPVRVVDSNSHDSQNRLLRAHEILASLSESNQQKFQPIVDAMRDELGERN